MNYLISSQSYRLMEETIEDIIKDSKNVTKFDLTFDNLDEIIEEAAYFSLFDEEKYLIIKNAEMFTASKTKIESDSLLSYLENPNPNTILIFCTSNKIDSRKTLTTNFKKNNEIITIKNMSAKEIYDDLNARLKKEKINIDRESLYYIINNSLNNYDLAYNTIEKIKLYYGESKDFKYKDIVEMVPINIEDNSFKFVEYTINKEYKKSIKCLNDLVLCKVDPFLLINLLFREYKLILQTKVMMKNKKNNNEIMSELKLQDWMIDKYVKLGYNFTENKLETIIHQLLELDFSIKSGKIDKLLGLKMFILSN